MSNPTLIAVDWGTTAMRAWLVDDAGAAIEERVGQRGIRSLPGGGFDAVLSDALTGWPAGLPVLMAGMIGSRQGWVEAPYVACPAAVDDLAAALTPAPAHDRTVQIVPGLRLDARPCPDVLRGEETQVFGALAHTGLNAGRFLLPGTHCKHVEVEHGRVVRFTTYLTGELYAACREHTILGRLMSEGPADAQAFDRGVREGAEPGGAGALLSRLFRVRAAGLFEQIDSVALADYLSGLLVGAELSDLGPASGKPIHIVAGDTLAQRYARAAEALGLPTAVVTERCVLGGFMTVARLAGLIPH